MEDQPETPAAKTLLTIPAELLQTLSELIGQFLAGAGAEVAPGQPVPSFALVVFPLADNPQAAFLTNAPPAFVLPLFDRMVENWKAARINPRPFQEASKSEH